MTYPVVYLRQPGDNNLQKYSFGKIFKLSVGRDESCDIVVEQAHVSSFHLELVLDMFNEIVCVDTSTNGTFLGAERLPNDMPYVLGSRLTVLDLRMNVELAICHSEGDELSYLKSIGVSEIPEEKNKGSVPSDATVILPTPKDIASAQAPNAPRARQHTRIINMRLWSPEASYQRKQSSSNAILGIVVLFLGLTYVGVMFGKQIATFVSSFLK